MFSRSSAFVSQGGSCRQPTLLVLLLILCSTGAMAEKEQTPSSATPQTEARFAFYQFGEFLEGTEESKLEIGKIGSLVDDMARESELRADELRQLRQQQTQESVIKLREESLRLFQDHAQREINQKRAEFIRRVGSRLTQILEEYGAEKGLDAIVVLDQAFPTYVRPALDVTQDLIRVYNERFPLDAASSDP